MKLISLHNKSLQELHGELIHVWREQFNLKMQISSGKFKKFHILKKIRKNIARIKTLMTEKGKNIK